MGWLDDISTTVGGWFGGGGGDTLQLPPQDRQYLAPPEGFADMGSELGGTLSDWANAGTGGEGSGGLNFLGGLVAGPGAVEWRRARAVAFPLPREEGPSSRQPRDHRAPAQHDPQDAPKTSLDAALPRRVPQRRSPPSSGLPPEEKALARAAARARPGGRNA